VQIGYGMMIVRRWVISKHIMHGRVLSPSQEKNIVGYSAVKKYIPRWATELYILICASYFLELHFFLRNNVFIIYEKPTLYHHFSLRTKEEVKRLLAKGTVGLTLLPGATYYILVPS